MAGAGREAAQKATDHLPLNFGKRLAHTDKAVRDRGFKTLKTWITKHPELERLDYMKLWKGLYFGMWMADKRPVQQELAVKTAFLLNDIPRQKQSIWVDAFWETMEEAWEKLDTHRMNKFMLFTRIVVAEAFKAIRIRGWDLDELRTVARTFTRATTAAASGAGPNVHSLGLLLQFVHMFWDELKPQLEHSPEAPPNALMELLEPFCAIAERSYSAALVNCIHSDMLRKAPAEVSEVLRVRVVAASSKEGVPKKNREAFKETAKLLGADIAQEQEESSPAQKPRKNAIRGSKFKREAIAARKGVKFVPMEEKKKPKKPEQKEEKVAEDSAAKTGSSAKESNRLVMSPLMLPKAAIAIDGPPKGKTKKAKTNRKSSLNDKAKAPADGDKVETTPKTKRKAKATTSGAVKKRKRAASVVS